MLNKACIRTEIERFVRQYQTRLPPGRECWRTPATGFAAAGDPLFQQLKRVVSPAHALPRDLLPSARTVIAYFIPFAKSIGESNRAGRLASPEWAHAYIETNRLIHDLGDRLKNLLAEEGYEAVAPPATHNFDEQRLISGWSHRHVAFIAGLGRFGMNHMLITARGCCGRLGSLVTSLVLPAGTRPVAESCLHRHDSSCLLCVGRCVGPALFPDRFDRHRCYAVCRENENLHQAVGKADVCGKCLAGVPCSWTDPVRAKQRSLRKRARADFLPAPRRRNQE